MEAGSPTQFGAAPGYHRLSDIAYAKLRYAIMEGQLAAGARLPEPELSRKLGVGRTPLHDALLRLVGDGLVDSIPKAGFSVRHLTLEDVEMAYRMRAALECLAVRVACERGFPNTKILELERACNTHEEGIQRREPRIVYGADLSFHQLIVTLPNSPRLEAAVRGSHLQFFTWSRTMPTDEYLKANESFVRMHRQIVEHLRTRNGIEAERSLAAHIEGGFRRRLEMIARRPDPAQVLQDMRVVGELAGGSENQMDQAF